MDRRHISHGYHSLSDELRAEVRFRGLAVDRAVLRSVGHELRLKHGSDVLSRKVLDSMALDIRQGRQLAVVVIDAIRNPAEVSLLRESLGSAFVLTSIEAPDDAIVARIRDRGRQGDILGDDDLARQVLAAEMGLNEPDHGHNIGQCIAMADVRVCNDGPLAELKQTVRHFVDEHVPVQA